MYDLEALKRSFLSHYKGETKKLYEMDLRLFFAWCEREAYCPIEIRRSELEQFRWYLEDERNNRSASVSRRLFSLKQFYKLLAIDGVITRNPAEGISMPRVGQDAKPIAKLSRTQVKEMLSVARSISPAHFTLVSLMAVLGLRVSEACNAQIEDLRVDEMGYFSLVIKGKGGRVDKLPLPLPVARAVTKSVAGRSSGPIILRKNGTQQDRSGAYHWIREVARKTGLPKDIHPHSLRHAAITTVLDSGADLRDAQLFARHADIRITMHYDRRELTYDNHPAHLVARQFAS